MQPFEVRGLQIFSTVHFVAKIFALKSRCRRKKHQKNSEFWCPRFRRGKPQIFDVHFQTWLTFQTCSTVWLSSMWWPPRSALEKEKGPQQNRMVFVLFVHVHGRP